VRADREQLTQVLVNLVQNASDAAREKQGESGGRVIVSLAQTEHGGARIVVSDNGPGIPNDSRASVLEPYYTTKSHGTGLGLAIVDRIVSDHGGTLSIGDDVELGGAAITIELRREGPSEEPESSVGV
jgi:nitrogen fixation/metabolism regulation signal transduction histidine kinase